MRTIRLVIELDYDNELWHGDDEKKLEYFRDEILDGHLSLYSHTMSQAIGDVGVISYVP